MFWGLANIVAGECVTRSCWRNMEGLVTWRSGLGEGEEVGDISKVELIKGVNNQGLEREPNG